MKTKKNKRKIWLWGLLTLVLVVGNLQLAFGHNWWYWHWHDRTLQIGIWNFVPEANAARQDWNRIRDLSLSRVSTHSDISAWGGNFGATGWAGLAEIKSIGADWPWHCGISGIFGVGFCRITHGHARVNTFYRNTRLSLFQDRQRVFCQEIGHTLGLGHNRGTASSNRNCMNDTDKRFPFTNFHNVNDINNKF